MMTLNNIASKHAKAYIGRALGALFIGICLLAIALSAAMPHGSSAASTTTSTPNGIWISSAELAALPMSGPAWTRLKAAADGSLGTPNIADQNSNHDVNTLAVALVYARTGTAAYRVKAANAIMAAIGTERGGRTLALGRNLAGYVIAADLINLKTYDAAKDQQFRAWLSAVRTETLDGLTLIQTHEQRPTNWGTNAGASRVAADIYLGDTADLNRAATVFRGWLGERAAFAGFHYDPNGWQCNTSAMVGINPPCVKQGHDIGGVLPADMVRGCDFTWLPCYTNYAWGGLGPALVEAELLARQGYPAWSWSNNALLRAVQFLYNLKQAAPSSNWWATGDQEWMPYLANHAYKTHFPVAMPARSGKSMGWTDWTHSR